ncbi:helix-turn-helix domain-containing protein [Staphylococcus saprophyticus]|uniref:helix-turn-helix domain-containing protein n=1 Tax=Staphylococcus saprophyticus TaxID=29385 RepID=UPI0019CFC4E9|nr:helix-turn-helix transcriptional regulator [Staphylococcus saprophyticus]MBN6755890.1 helix-turn-helix transcriptional regulator [Staphylococcus saprophyticus]MBN6765868.1 helix-turn-helix transcriptional regulator [Staphylococcus saprophyticus]MBN6771231.1 helix-turn-helix transcriptional regulator [Staphylococcus saprophyticus]MBN6780203.1 helix-turn-helix transcriptional regulator [Staphylococcus saprophyticus]MBN6787633.1 helix-turn-helix transcriptional regulator [Staphylococcus saprop
MIKCTLKDLIERHEVTQTDIANTTGITRPTLLALMRNDAQGIKFSTLEKLCDYFNIEISELLVSDKSYKPTKQEQLDHLINIARQLKSELQ